MRQLDLGLFKNNPIQTAFSMVRVNQIYAMQINKGPYVNLSPDNVLIGSRKGCQWTDLY